MSQCESTVTGDIRHEEAEQLDHRTEPRMERCGHGGFQDKDRACRQMEWQEKPCLEEERQFRVTENKLQKEKFQ